MTIKDLFGITIPSFALCVALYTFLSNNSKFKEFSPKFWSIVFLQLISILLLSLLLIIDSITLNLSIIYRTVLYLYLAIFLLSWLYMGRLFFVIFGSLYHLRKKRFLKYTKTITKIYEILFHKKSYETTSRERKTIPLTTLNLERTINLDKLKTGGTVLILVDDNLKYIDTITKIIEETISSGETVDYVNTYRNPIEVCDSLKYDTNIIKKLSIIDCFLPLYGFDDKVLKFRLQDRKDKGFHFFYANSFAEIHSAANSSWYRFRKLCESEEKSMYRLPHRTIYDSLTTLVEFSSTEQFFLFIRHVINSEKSYNMVTILIESTSLNNSIKNSLIKMSDLVLEIADEYKITCIKSI